MPIEVLTTLQAALKQLADDAQRGAMSPTAASSARSLAAAFRRAFAKWLDGAADDRAALVTSSWSSCRRVADSLHHQSVCAGARVAAFVARRAAKVTRATETRPRGINSTRLCRSETFELERVASDELLAAELGGRRFRARVCPFRRTDEQHRRARRRNSDGIRVALCRAIVRTSSAHRRAASDIAAELGLFLFCVCVFALLMKTYCSVVDDCNCV